MILGLIQAQAYGDWLRLEHEKRRPASTRGLDECVRCGYCCTARTCVPTPDELEGIAAFLGLPVAQMLTDYMVGDEQEGHHFLRWANKAQQLITGEFLTDHDTFTRGECVFFDDGTCRIYDMRPRDARGSSCWHEHDRFDSRMEWKDGQLEQLCPEMDIYDSWDW